MARGQGTKIPTRIQAFVFGVLLGGTSAGSPLFADPCPSGVGPFGGCFVTTTLHPGEFPFGITVAESEGRVIVTELFSGLFYKYREAALFNPPSVFVGPLGVAMTTGVAYRPDPNADPPIEDQLFWIIEESGEQMLIVTDLLGIIEQIVGPIRSPGKGLIGDITYNEDSQSFWGVDIENDVYFEFLDDATTTGETFSSPGLPPAPIGGGAYGSGITSIPSLGLGALFDVTIGLPKDLGVSQVLRIDSGGDPFGLFFALDNENQLNGFITGLAYSAEGTNPGIEVEYVLDASNNRLVEIPVQNPNARSVVNFTCATDEENNVTLAWTNTQAYSQIVIRRDGQPLNVNMSDVDPGDVLFMDPAVDDGTHEYELIPSTAAGSALPLATCEVVVGFGRGVNAVLHAGDEPHAVTVVENSADDSLSRVIVADLFTGNAFRYGKDLTLVDSIPSPFGPDTTTAGLAWNSASNSLFWLGLDTNGDQFLVETDLDGDNAGTPVSLESPEAGVVGDISYDASTDTFWGVDITFNRYFQFDANGVAQAGFANPLAGGFGRGVTAVGKNVLDVAVGAGSNAVVDRILRVTTEGNNTGIEFDLGPTTMAGLLGGLAYTSSGSGGGAADYIVGTDTNTIYELSLQVGIGTPFRRGDANDISGVEISDVTFTLSFLFAPGSPVPPCLDAADSNDILGVEISDVTYTLNFLFLPGSPDPPAPGPFACGVDTTASNLTCESYTSCP